MPAFSIAGNSKVKVCHYPPGNSQNFHLITISDSALSAHLNHGDRLGSCFETCDELCSDGNACTIDECDLATGSCVNEHPLVDCNDGNLCTIDSCDPNTGCVNTQVNCDDSNACTTDTCNNGSCINAPIDCGEGQLCDTALGCYDPCGGVVCEPINQCHELGQCEFPGECAQGQPKADGTACDDLNQNTEGDQCIAGTCTGTQVAVPEICDGIDNDADGDIDEGWPELGDPCLPCPIGYPCSRQCDVANPTGPTVCASAPPFWGCDPDNVSTEVCDGLDNDCNGPVDDGYQWENLGDPCVDGDGSTGIYQCDVSDPAGNPVCVY